MATDLDLLSTPAWQLQSRLTSGELTSLSLVDRYLAQIGRHDSSLHAVLHAASGPGPGGARAQAAVLDAERRAGKIRGPLHGIPVLVKDVFTTAGGQIDALPTTCGAMALADAYGKEDARAIKRLRAAGAIVLAKTNLNEYVRLRDVGLGWSALGGQTESAFVVGGGKGNGEGGDGPVGNSRATGSSAGSAVGVSAGYAPLALGTETIGSVVIPANRAGLCALKVTSARAPTEGVLLLSREIDSVGAMAKCARDLREVTRVMLERGGEEEKGIETDDASSSPSMPMSLSSSSSSWTNLHVGFVNMRRWQFGNEMCRLSDATRDWLVSQHESLVSALRTAGLHVVTDVDLSSDPIEYEGEGVVGQVVSAQFRTNFAAFASGLTNTAGAQHPIRTLTDLIAWNESHADVALPEPYPKQADLHLSNTTQVSAEHVAAAVAYGQHVARTERLDRALDAHKLDLLIAPGDSALMVLAGCAGYPIATMPLVMLPYDDENGNKEEEEEEDERKSEVRTRPEGISILARPDGEDRILDFMEGCEGIIGKLGLGTGVRDVPAALLRNRK